MDDDFEIVEAEREMLGHAIEIMTEAIEIKELMVRAYETGQPAWRWAELADPIDVLEAASAFQAFPPCRRP